ncbi:adenylosuccinate lyase [Xanthomonas arboricola]|uniref:adenylosuccinate lyase n=1 Tax=Xanthomonas arboricola TaxID=56448 RepID=UPI000CEDDD78|nr:adenylosuccinate lyase [Xanthomonas arboricola]MBB6572342.1 hypothetical protein [Xanthomonas arboricola]PPT88139.1 adenylosuccinate lyase [Xanthomonas arboricola]
MTPGFSERTFEFCFNAEYCRINAALLASHPHIPSQQMEKDLGYDVEFKIRHGRYTRSLFLQHKVSSFATVRAGRNRKFYDSHMAPYYRFPVDNDQHNTLCDLSRTKGNAFYCAPVYHERSVLENHFFGNSVTPNAVLLDPLQVGLINDTDRHNITFNQAGLNATLHSDVRRFSQEYTGGQERRPPLERVDVTLDYVEELSEQLLADTRTNRFEPYLSREFRATRPVERVQILLAHVYDVTWLLLP